MQKKGLPRRVVAVWGSVLVLAGASSSLLVQLPGCVWFVRISYCSSLFYVRGLLLEPKAQEPVSGAAIGGRSFTDGEETDYDPAIIFDGSPGGPLSAEDGGFAVEFSKVVTPCPDPKPGFPRPDRVEIIVVRDGCEQTFTIDINEETARDVEDAECEYADVIELTDPILVPPCEE